MARSDFALYPNAAAILENFLLLPQGAITRRPGTQYVATAKASSGPYRLIPFERSADQAYIIEVGQGYFRFFTRQGQILSGGSPYEIATPYTSFDPFKLQWAQQDDIMILVHPDFPPQQLSRIAEDNWTIAEFEVNDGPLLATNTTAVTLQPSGVSGAITITASAVNTFDADHVGAYFAFGVGVLTLTEWAEGQTIAINELRGFEGRFYRATTAGTTGNVALTHKSGAVSDGGVTWQYLQTGEFGTVKITGFTSSTVVSAEVPAGRELFAASAATPTTNWKEGAWSGVRGYPRALTLFDNRSWFGGTAHQPQTFWASGVGDFSDFHAQGTIPDDPVTDDGSIEATLQSNQVSPILWMMVRDDVIAGTSNGPWTISASGGGVITPLNVQASRQSTMRCSTVPAVELNSSLMFVPRDKRSLHDLRFDFNVDKFEAIDQTLLSSHILDSGVIELAYQAQPHSTLWALRADGVLATFAFNRAEEIRGWCRQLISGTDIYVRSVAAIPGDDQTGSEDRDEVWLAVERTIDGSTVTYIEFVEGFHEEANDVHDAWHVDSGLRYNGVSTTTISGLDHLEAETVTIWGDSGAIESDKIVASGSITLDNAVTSAIVGLSTTCTFQALPFDAGSPLGTSLTKKQKLSKVRMQLYLTSGLKVSEGDDDDDFQDVYSVDRGILKSNPYDRLTGQYEIRLRNASWSHNPQPIFKNETAGPTTILGIVPWIEGTE